MPNNPFDLTSPPFINPTWETVESSLESSLESSIAPEPPCPPTYGRTEEQEQIFRQRLLSDLMGTGRIVLDVAPPSGVQVAPPSGRIQSLPRHLLNRLRPVTVYDEASEIDEDSEDEDEINVVEDGEDNDEFYSSLVYDTNSIPKVAPVKFSTFKARLKALQAEPNHSNTYHFISLWIVSSAVKRYGSAWNESSNLREIRESYIKFIAKSTGFSYILDEVNSHNLVFSGEEVHVHSADGIKITSYLTVENYCNSCTITGDLWVLDDMIRVSDRGFINPVSYDELGYWHCDACNTERPFHEDNCVQCIGRGSQMEIGHLYRYTDNVRNYIPQLFDIRKKAQKKQKGRNQERPKPKLYFGVEVEIVPREGVTQQDALYWLSTAMHGHALMKADASLLGGGFEIVTAPATLEYHRTKMWEKLFTLKLPKNGSSVTKLVKSWDTSCCGTHVHFTKAALSDVQLAKFLVFYHDSKNARFLSSIAGRIVGPDATYCHQDKKRLYFKKDKHGRVIQSTISDCTGEQRHHEAVTISHRNNGKTVEVRIFKGNITKHGIMRSLEFVAATIEWCGGNGVKELTKEAFLNWFDHPNNRSRYPDLWKHLLSLRFLGTRHVSKGKKRLEELPKDQKAA